MSILSSISKLFNGSDGLVCPRCEKPLEGHDEKACEMRMSRRYFFGLAAGAVAVAAGVQALPEWEQFTVTQCVTSNCVTPGNRFLTHDQITKEVLTILQRNTINLRKYFEPAARRFANELDARVVRTSGWGQAVHPLKVGDTINIRRPARFVKQGLSL